MADQFKVVEKFNHYLKVEEAIKFMQETGVYVGIPQAKSKNEERGKITNAGLLYIHTNGSPVNHIPPRPVIEPAIANDRDRLNSMMLKATQEAIDGEREKAIEQLKRTGMRAQNICRGWFYNPKNGWPPNSPATIRAKMKKKSTEPRPLIDTAQMKNSITYFVNVKGRNVE